MTKKYNYTANVTCLSVMFYIYCKMIKYEKRYYMKRIFGFQIGDYGTYEV